MAAELVHAYEWDTNDTQYFLGLGLGHEEVSLYTISSADSTGACSNGQRKTSFDTEDVVRTWSYSRQKPGRVGYGLNSGAVHVRDLYGTGTSHNSSGIIGSSGYRAGAIIKHRATRKCNSVSFNSQNLICSGYEKTRGMESLLLWDLDSDLHTPVNTVPVVETIACAQFIPSNPFALLFGCGRSIKEYDTRSNTFATSVSTNMSMKINLNPLNDSIFASYGETLQVALWDRRMLRLSSSQSEPLLVIPRVFSNTQKFDSHCFRWSLYSESEFAVLAESSLVRRWQTSVMHRHHKPHQPSQLTSSLSVHPEVPNEGKHSVNGGGVSSSQRNNQAGDEFSGKDNLDAVFNTEIADLLNTSLFVSKVYDVRTETDKVVSFDYSGISAAKGLELVCMRQSGTIFKISIHGPPLNIYFDPFNDFKMMSGSTDLVETSMADHSRLTAVSLSKTSQDCVARVLRTGNGENLEDKWKKSYNVPSERRINLSDGDSDAGELEDEITESDDDESSVSDSASNFDSFIGFGGEISLSTVLNNDIISLMQRRALAGYSLDTSKNIRLLSSPKLNPSAVSLSTSTDSGLLVAWKWLNQQQTSTEKGFTYLETPEVDLKFIGVYNIWNGLTRETLEPRLSARVRVSKKTVIDAVKYVLRKSPGSVYVKAEDDLFLYRQLCLRLTGWDFGLTDLEPRLEQLEKEGKHEKAAGWAVFHDNVERAVESLANSSKKSLRLMSTAIAGYIVYKDVEHNNIWREQCRRLASELSSPYLRAIFAYISDGSWLDVLDDGSLPLTERLGIALRFLPKKDVGKYLSLLTSRAISNGDLEGLILTGLTPKALDLLQAYLDRTGDIQTVCHLVSFGWPQYFEDYRLKSWFTEYRNLLNSWKYFGQRARFDIARSKLSNSQYSNRQLHIRGQAFLKCSHCKENISGKKDATDGQKWTSSAARSEPLRQLHNRCLSCNHPLPSCGICMLPLGPCLDDKTGSDHWPVFCLQCNHGCHSVHARQWFKKYDICPIPSCPCLCGKTVGINSKLN